MTSIFEAIISESWGAVAAILVIFGGLVVWACSGKRPGA